MRRFPHESVLPGETILQDRYQINRVLNCGAFTVVYLALDMRFPHEPKLVAIKEIVNVAPDQRLVERLKFIFERRANLLAILSHPAIPRIYDYFQVEDRAYIVTEYIEGRDLGLILEEMEEFLPEERVVPWAIAICDVLQYLHSQKPHPIIHRDVKPQHVLVDLDDKVHLVGFAIACYLLPGTRGTMIGTEGYAPPEQYRGVVSPQSDIYALGATLHHVLTKRDPCLEPPFTFHEHPPRSLNPKVSERLEAVVMKALEYEIEDRYPSAEEMKLALVALGY